MIPRPNIGDAWRADAACRGEDPNLFFPNGSERPAERDQIRRAKAICRRCDVQAECLAYAMNAGPEVEYGIWGSLTEDERRDLRRADRAAGVRLARPINRDIHPSASAVAS